MNWHPFDYDDECSICSDQCNILLVTLICKWLSTPNISMSLSERFSVEHRIRDKLSFELQVQLIYAREVYWSNVKLNVLRKDWKGRWISDMTYDYEPNNLINDEC